MKKLAALLTLVIVQQAAAGTSVWKGEGALFGINGTSQGEYELTVTNTKSGDVTESNIHIKTAEGSVIDLQCTNTAGSEDSWSSLCGHGKGGGSCFGEGLCISYLDSGNGKAFATTIVMDGAADMRLLRTELQNGKAVRFFREKLHKQ